MILPNHDTSAPPIGGTVAPGFEAVRTAFEENFRRGGPQGAACAVYHRGRKVVDLWGGYQDIERRVPWTPETLTLTFSVTKGMAAAAMVVALDRGLFQLDAPVADYWPEFARGGKHAITVRQLLAHQAGLIGLDRQLDAAILADPQRLAVRLADQRPHWTPGERHGYHTVTLGWYQSELLRRTDPAGRSVGEFFRDEIAEPLAADFLIGLPQDVDESRLSRIEGFHRVAMLAHLHELPPRMVLAGAWPRSLVARSIRTLPLNNPAHLADSPFRHVEIPSAGGFGTALGIARVYDCLVRGGAELGLGPATRTVLHAPSTLPGSGLEDAILKIPTCYHLGFSRPSDGFPFGSDAAAYGCPGAGGSFGMADPQQELAFAFVTNKMGFRLFDDPRERAVREACYRCLGAAAPKRIAAVA